MRVEINNLGTVESQHLPRVDQSSLLKIGTNGRVKAIEKLQTPVNEFGIPRPEAFLANIVQTLDARYVPPSDANIHHLVYPRARYHEGGKDSIPYKFRETPSLKIRIPIQVHGYAHWVTEPIAMPSMDVMTQVVKEQDQIDRLFRIGRGAVTATKWLDEMIGTGMQAYRTAEMYVQAQESEEAFYDYLDSCEEPQIGIMPIVSELANMEFESAVRYLGGLSAAKALNLRRRTLEGIEQDGLS